MAQLLGDSDARLLQLETQGNQNCYNCLSRMKVLDAIHAPEIPFQAEDGIPVWAWTSTPSYYIFESLVLLSRGSQSFHYTLSLLDGWDGPYGTGVCSQREHCSIRRPWPNWPHGQGTEWELSATTVSSWRPNAIS